MAAGVGVAAGGGVVGAILIGAGAILIGVTAAVMAAVTAAVTGTSRIGRLPKNLCSARGLERGVQNSRPFLVRFLIDDGFAMADQSWLNCG